MKVKAAQIDKEIMVIKECKKDKAKPKLQIK
jgi:hypothetical protein